MASACAVHILIKTEKQAAELKHNLITELTLLHLQKIPLCPSKNEGGDLGEFRRGEIVKAFDDVVFKRPILKVHEPIKTKFGYHLMKTFYRS